MKINDPKGEAGAKKAPMWLLPPVALEQTAWVHKLGSEKYGRLVPIPASSCGEELVEFCSCDLIIEPLSATDATKGLASSETIRKLLKKHSPTCSVRSLQIREGHVWQRGDFNWRRTGVCATTYISAIMRHLNAWRDGEDLDPESGISHIAHIATSCNILMDAAACGTLQDDRNKKPVADLATALSEWGDDGLKKVGEYIELNECPWTKLVRESAPADDLPPQQTTVAPLLEIITPGTHVAVWPLFCPTFFSVVEKIVDVRGEKVYTFSNGETLAASDLYKITPVPTP